jgi:hypothetical protein
LLTNCINQSIISGCRRMVREYSLNSLPKVCKCLLEALREHATVFGDVTVAHCMLYPLYVVSQQYRETSSLHSFARSLLVMTRGPCYHRRSNIQAHLREFWNFQAPSFGFFFDEQAWICRRLQPGVRRPAIVTGFAAAVHCVSRCSSYF